MAAPKLETEGFSLEDFSEELSDNDLRYYLARQTQYIKAMQRDLLALKAHIDALHP